MESFQEYVKSNLKLSQAGGLQDNLNQLLIDLIDTTKSASGMVISLGNGGSQTTAEHFVTDLSLQNKRTGTPIRALCLNSPGSTNSALSNDLNFETALSEQLKNFSNSQNLIIAFSASGNSTNIINAYAQSQKNNQKFWAFLGFDGGKLIRREGLSSIFFPTEIGEYGIVENLHLMATHYLVDKLNQYWSMK
jgi:D-sedoheptulose 7-phosphate isomerase